MTWNKPLNDKKWTVAESYALEVRRNKIANLMNQVVDEINLIMDLKCLTFITPFLKVDLLTSLREAHDKLDSAKSEVEVWYRSPDIYKA